MKLTVKVIDSRHGNEWCLIKSIERYRELTKEAIDFNRPSQARKESIRLVTAIKKLLEHRNYYLGLLKSHGYGLHQCRLHAPYYNCLQADSIKTRLRPIDKWLTDNGLSLEDLNV